MSTFRLPHGVQLDGYTLDLSSGATTNQVLQYNGTSFVAGTVSGSMSIGGSITSATSGSVLFVNSSSQLAQNNTAFFWNDTNKVLKITQSAADPADGTGALTLQNTLNTSVSQITWRDHSGTFKAALGLANSGGTGPNYFYLDNSGLGLNFQGPGGQSAQIYAGTVNQAGIQLWNGSSLGASASSTGRIIYNSSGQKFQASLNGGTYGDVLAGNGLYFTSSTFRVGIGTAAATPGYALDIRDANTGGECIAVRNLSASGYSDIVWFDSSNIQKGAIGWGNASVGATTLQSRNFFYTPNLDWVMSDGTTNFFRWYNGSGAIGFELSAGNSATASASSTGKIRYNSSSQHFQISENAGSYINFMNIGSPVSNSTSGSIPFINSSNNLAQDNTNLFWDASNASLGIGMNSPGSEKLYVQSSVSAASTAAIKNTSSTGYSTIVFYNSSGTERGAIGVANASAGATNVQNTMYVGSPGNVVVTTYDPTTIATFFNSGKNFNLGTTTTDPSIKLNIETASTSAGIGLGAGNSLAVSSSSTGRIRYNSSTQHFEVSENAGTYAQVVSGNSKIGLSLAQLGVAANAAGQITDGAGSYTYGDMIVMLTDGFVLAGAKFYWPGGHGALTVRVSLWDGPNTSRIIFQDVSVNAAGIYTATFSSSQTLSAYYDYRLTVWETSGARNIYVTGGQIGSIVGTLTITGLNDTVVSPGYYRHTSVYTTGDGFPTGGDASDILGLIDPVFV